MSGTHLARVFAGGRLARRSISPLRRTLSIGQDDKSAQELVSHTTWSQQGAESGRSMPRLLVSP